MSELYVHSNSDSDSDLDDFEIGADGSILLSKTRGGGGGGGDDIVISAEDDDTDDDETDYTVMATKNIYSSGGDGGNGGDGGDGGEDEEYDPVPVMPPPEDDDINEEDDIDMLRKIKHLDKSDILRKYHPECISINHQELDSYLTVVKDDRGNIIDPLHTTLPVLTKYEYTRIIGMRTQQLSEGARPYIEVPDQFIIEDNYLIAEEEFKQRKLPFIIGRPLPNGGCEYWRVTDLEYLR
jgi:DNA-directed RNA polymerase subunit K/omega